MHRKKLSKISFINKKFFLFGLTIVLAIGGLFLTNKIFQVQQIILVNEKTNDRIFGLDSFKKQNLLFLNPKKESDSLLQENPQYQDITITKNYPNQLLISSKIAEPVAVLKTAPGFFFLSSGGKIISKKKENKTTLPQINYYQNFYYYQYQAGEVIDYNDMIKSLGFLQKIKALGLPVDTIDISGSDMVAFNLNGKTILFSQTKDSGVQDYQLSMIIKQFKIEGKDFVKLDLRFDKPVIKIK